MGWGGKVKKKSSNPAGIYMFKANNINTRTRCKVY